MSPLSAKQQTFVDGVISGKTNTQAYLDAYGGSENAARANSCRLIARDSIAAEITRRQAKAAAKADLSREWVLTKLKENTDRAMQAVPVMMFDPVAKKMVESGEWEYEGAVANRSIELIGKDLGMFSEKLVHSGTVAVRVEIVREGRRRSG